MEIGPVPFFTQEDYSHFYNLFADTDPNSLNNNISNSNKKKRNSKEDEDEGGGGEEKRKGQNGKCGRVGASCSSEYGSWQSHSLGGVQVLSDLVMATWGGCAFQFPF
ncbi:hypothetical protein E2542_SST01570 [Spatholobus suberectus]|nr:hypothetical protein E2542_SST01570 [Spatholobus suberectus]